MPWTCLEREVADRGAYFLILRLARPRRIAVGALGTLQFRAGYYVYVGSAMRNLSARLARHRRRRKHLHWHIDFLRAAADQVLPLAVPSSRRLECDLARALAEILEAGPAGFGASDCRCPTHLFHSTTHPLDGAAFHAVLQRFRTACPD